MATTPMHCNLVPMLVVSYAKHAVLPAGAQISKMTPFRSYVITTASTLTSTIASDLRLGGGMTSYIVVRPSFCHFTCTTAVSLVACINDLGNSNSVPTAMCQSQQLVPGPAKVASSLLVSHAWVSTIA